MNIIVVGSGGREHTICWKLAQSSVVDKVIVVPGNGGTAYEEKCVNIDPKACDYIAEGENPYVAIAKHENCRMAVIGPEDPLASHTKVLIYHIYPNAELSLRSTTQQKVSSGYEVFS